MWKDRRIPSTFMGTTGIKDHNEIEEDIGRKPRESMGVKWIRNIEVPKAYLSAWA